MTVFIIANFASNNTNKSSYSQTIVNKCVCILLFSHLTIVVVRTKVYYRLRHWIQCNPKQKWCVGKTVRIFFGSVSNSPSKWIVFHVYRQFCYHYIGAGAIGQNVFFRGIEHVDLNCKMHTSLIKLNSVIWFDFTIKIRW